MTLSSSPSPLCRNTCQVEEQRRYLGGDSEHTVLVKGLDFALLEQNKARAVAGSAEDDDSLEQAFLETTVPKKRTREEIVQELKNKRAKAGNVDENVGNGEAGGGAEEKGLEIAKKAGKFKPIGSGSKEGTKKKVKVKKVKKSAKESKIPEESKSPTIDGNANKPAEPSQPAASSSNIKSKPIPEQEPMDEDFDIFADVGEYQGIDLGDDDSDSNSEEGETKQLKPPKDDKPTSQDESEDLPQKKWFDLDDEPRAPLPPPPSVPQANSNNSPLRRSHSPSTPTIDHEPTEGRDALEDGEMEEDKPMRLVPLSSSAIPSIKDILAMDDAVKKQDKRKAKKEKKKGGGGSGLTDERKVDRDYQRYIHCICC